MFMKNRFPDIGQFQDNWQIIPAGESKIEERERELDRFLASGSRSHYSSDELTRPFSAQIMDIKANIGGNPYSYLGMTKDERNSWKREAVRLADDLNRLENHENKLPGHLIIHVGGYYLGTDIKMSPPEHLRDKIFLMVILPEQKASFGYETETVINKLLKLYGEDKLSKENKDKCKL